MSRTEHPRIQQRPNELGQGHALGRGQPPKTISRGGAYSQGRQLDELAVAVCAS